MKVLIILLMFVMSLYSAASIVDNERWVELSNGVKVSSHLATSGCVALAVITVAFDAACLYILVKVV